MDVSLSDCVDDLCYLPASEAVQLFRSGKLSPVELLTAQIEQFERVEPRINAFSATFFELAIEQAKASERRYASNTKRGSLDGLTLAAKEENLIKGFPLEHSSILHKGEKATKTSEVIKRIQAAGAIIHAQTTTPEFSCATICHSKLRGVTRNPWNLEYSSGGSSGGAGASLAAGTTTLATGSDIAGSIRIPASACGLVGFKPPHGRVPQNFPFNYDSFCHAGPMARTVADCILLENVMAGPSTKDITSLKPKLVIPEDPGSIKGMKIAYSADLGYFDVDPEVHRNTVSVLEMLRDAGAQVDEVNVGWTRATEKAALDYLGHFFGSSLGPALRKHPEDLSSYVVKFAEYGLATTAEDNIEALRVAGEMYLKLGHIHETYDALICPTLALPSVPADYDGSEPVWHNSNQRHSDPMMIGWCMTYPFNMLNRCPVLQMPSGLSSVGIPTGVQIVGRTFEDIDVFKIGLAIEQAQNWYQSFNMRPKV